MPRWPAYWRPASPRIRSSAAADRHNSAPREIRQGLWLGSSLLRGLDLVLRLKRVIAARRDEVGGHVIAPDMPGHLYGAVFQAGDGLEDAPVIDGSGQGRGE